MSILKNTFRNIFGNTGRDLSSNYSSTPLVEGIQQKNNGAIIYFSAQSEGDALAKMAREFLSPLSAEATAMIEINVNHENWYKTLETHLSEPVWFAYSPFGVGQLIDARQGDRMVNLWEAANIPFVRTYGDTPAYFPDRHLGKFRNSINTYSDPNHLNFYKTWFSDQALSVVLPPLPIEYRPIDEIESDIKLNSKIIFLKNGNSPRELTDYWATSIPKEISSALFQIAEECTTGDALNQAPKLDVRLIDHFEKIGINLRTERSTLCFLVAQLDDYIRRIKSTMIAEALIDLPIIIRGKNWEHVDFNKKRATHDRNSDYASSQPLFDQAPAIIDMSPNTVTSPHDRICRAMGRGTAFITNEQEFCSGLLPQSDPFTYQFNPQSIRDIVEYYVLHPKAAVELGFQQTKAFREKYTRENYAHSLRSTISLTTLRQNGRPPGTQNFVEFPPQQFN